jgi:hypothetical protein
VHAHVVLRTLRSIKLSSYGCPENGMKKKILYTASTNKHCETSDGYMGVSALDAHGIEVQEWMS